MSDVLTPFEAPVRRWFAAEFAAPSPPQQKGWPAIAEGQHTLIMAPTGSGKTLAAFLWSINTLARELAAGRDVPGVHTLYLSPLKALGYDIEHNLREPLAGIQRAYEEADPDGASPEIRIAVRTGDTPPTARAAMVRRPPHLLVTTPESLFLLLSSPKARGILQAVRTVIVDEIHAVCESKRGSHLALSLERLERLTGRAVQRIGLSATQRPLAEVARFLGGGPETAPRPVTLVQAGAAKALDVEVVTPVADFTALPDDSVWPELLPRVLELIRAHRSTLVFVSMRAQAERIARQLNELAGEPLVQVHHGSLSQGIRRQVEHALRDGAVRAIVATGTLELGIDVGAVDLVVQLQSPGEVARGLQRVGRAGHQLDAVSRGRIFATFREDLVACTVIAQQMRQGWVEAVHIPEGPLDVLAQHVAAAAALEPWRGEDLRQVLRGAWPYRHLSREAFESVLRMLAGQFPAPGQQSFVTWDAATDRLRGRRGALPAVLRNSGAIPDSGYYRLVLSDGKTRLGELEEEFVYETVVGDVIQFGSSTWRVQDIDRERVVVSPAPGAPARMPFWKGGLYSRNPELGEAIGAFRREVAGRVEQPDVVDWLLARYPVDRWSAENLVAYLRDALQGNGGVPTDRTVVVEAFRDELRDHRLAVLSTFGGKLHAPLALALRRSLRERTGVDPQVLWDDDAVLLRAPGQGAPPLPTLLELAPPERVEDLVVRELRETPMFGTLFRHNAARALVLTGRRPRRTPLWLQRLRARDLLEAVSDYPDHPVRLETYRECLRDRMDVPALVRLLEQLRDGVLGLVEREVRTPSHLVLGAVHRFTAQYMYEYDEPRAERQLRRLQLNRELLDQLVGDGGLAELLEPQVVQELEAGWQGTAPHARARDADELFGLLGRLGELPGAPEDLSEVAARCTADPAPWVEALLSDGRVCEVALPTEPVTHRLVPAERLNRLRLAFHPQPVRLEAGTPPPADLDADLSPVEARQDRVVRLLAQRGPVPVEELARELGYAEVDLAPMLEALAAQGEVRRGHFHRDRPTPQACSRRTLEAIHRRTLAWLRRQVTPCDLPAFQAFLLHHQHVAPGERLLGEEALPRAVEQLAGRLVPASILEAEILRARFHEYRPEWLDRRVASGEVLWAGLPGAGGRRERVTLMFREDRPFLSAPAGSSSGPVTRRVAPEPPVEADATSPSEEADEAELERVRNALQRGGASFLFDLSQACGLDASRLVPALWTLVWRGEVTNDHVEALRHAAAQGFRAPESPINPFTGRPRALGRRRAAFRRQRGRRGEAAGAGGRWSWLAPPPVVDEEQRVEWLAWQLLRRFGVLSRDLVQDEWLPCRWGMLYGVLRRLEFGGELRRGHFVKGLRGAQFALPEAVEALRRVRDAPPSEEAVLVNACDPVLLPLLPEAPWPAGLGFHRIPSSYLVLEDGRVTLWAEQRGQKVHLAPGLTPPARVRAARALADLVDRPARFRAQRRLEVTWIDDGPALQAEARTAFFAAGFQETGTGLRLHAPTPAT